MGNLDSLRDWGHARDFVEMQWLMLQQEAPEDFVISTGNQCSVRDFIIMAAKELGLTLSFEGKGTQEIGLVTKIANEGSFIKPGDVIIRVDQSIFVLRKSKLYWEIPLRQESYWVGNRRRPSQKCARKWFLLTLTGC